MKLADIAGIAAIAKQHGLLLAVDNTFLTPVLQRPFELGADVECCLQPSTSKVITQRSVDRWPATTRSFSIDSGWCARRLVRIQAPLDAWLTLRGLKTLPLRMKAHSDTAVTIAEWLEAQPTVATVYYPGLDSFPQKALAERQQATFGGMLSFELKARPAEAIAVMNALKLWIRAESLGGVESLVTHPATATHADVPVETRQRLRHHRWSDSVVRGN